jgi:hypothetical protein
MLQQNGLLKNISAVNIRGINENWLPKLSLSAQGAYQTVMELAKESYQTQLSSGSSKNLTEAKNE